MLIYIGCSIDCFKCVSHNGNNTACDDPFHNNVSTAFLEAPCMGGRKLREGLFPATSCIKIAGYFGNYKFISTDYYSMPQNVNVSLCN